MGVCSLMHEPSAETGWDALPVMLRGQLHFAHVVPCGDLKRHQLDPACWCKPIVDEDDKKLLIHNAADGREDYEQGRAVS